MRRLTLPPDSLAEFVDELKHLIQKECPGGESNPHEEKSPEDFKSSASAIPPPGQAFKLNHLQ
jgi:hypothetical protein